MSNSLTDNEAVVRQKLSSRASKSKAYYSWQAMKARCYQPSHIGYPLYGGRGITVCDRWRGSYAAFVEDMGERPDGQTLDRIDPNGNYEPSNCRWADHRTQRWNQRESTKMESAGQTAFGRTQTFLQWSKEFGIKKNTLVSRVLNGMPFEKALTTPVERRGRWIAPKGMAVVPKEPTPQILAVLGVSAEVYRAMLDTAQEERIDG